VAQLNTEARHVTPVRYGTHYTHTTNSKSPKGFPETLEGPVNF